MYYQPYDRSMGLWIINEFLKFMSSTASESIQNGRPNSNWVSPFTDLAQPALIQTPYLTGAESNT